MDLTIRRARPDEAGVLTNLSMRSKRSNGYDDAFMAACRKELTVTGDQLMEREYWVAEAGAVCGCACLLWDPKDRSGEVHAFFIEPSHQRKGVGRLLWQRLLERAKEEELSRPYLDADPTAVPFYEALGFEVIGEEPSVSIPGRNLPRMAMVLAPPD